MVSTLGHKGNANQNHTEILPHPVRMAVIKKTINAVRMGGKGPLYTYARLAGM
jgi:hypothetical protein